MSPFLQNNLIAIVALILSITINAVVLVLAVIRINKSIAARDQKTADALADHEKRISLTEIEIKSLNPILSVLSNGVAEVKTAIGFIRDSINRIDQTLNKPAN